MIEKWKVFKLNGKEICSYTINGTFDGEEQATLELLAAENNCNISDIYVMIEERKIANALIEAISPFRYRYDIASQMIQKADCEEAERIKAMEWLKKFHKGLKVEIIE